MLTMVDYLLQSLRYRVLVFGLGGFGIQHFRSHKTELQSGENQFVCVPPANAGFVSDDTAVVTISNAATAAIAMIAKVVLFFITSDYIISLSLNCIRDNVLVSLRYKNK